MASAYLLLLHVLGRSTAYPQHFSCDYACMAGLTPGGSFGNMGISNFASTTGSNCVITTSVTASGYLPGQSYVVTVASSTALGRKLASDRAGFAAQNVVNAPTKTTSSSHNWMATADSSATFRALCGAGGSIDKMYVASAVTVQVAQTTTSTTTVTVQVAQAKRTSTSTTTTKLCLLPLVRGDEGYSDVFKGWYDVQGCGRCHDFCRWVGGGGISRGDPKTIIVHGDAWWSCRLAGSSKSRTDINHFQYSTGSFLFNRCASEGALPPTTTTTTTTTNAEGCKLPVVRGGEGYPGAFRGWYDVQGCGRCYDYCRWVGGGGVSRGDPKTILVHGDAWWSCRLAGSSAVHTPFGHYSSFKFDLCASEGAVRPSTTTTTTTTNKEGCKIPLTRSGAGYREVFRGWYDLQGCGRCHDYCRWVGSCGCGATCGDPVNIRVNINQYGTCFWSCRLAGSTNAYTANGHFSSFNFAQCESEGSLAPPPADNITEYVPGARGAPWTQAEMLVVRAKVHRVIAEGLTIGYEHGLANYTEAWTEIPNAAKLLRLGFHDCMKYKDGSGGCDGCLEWTGVGVRYGRHKMAKGYFTYSAAQDGANNGLANSAAILDALYTNRGFPHYTRTLPISLQQSGKSRADVWAFATLVAVEYSMAFNNRVCKNPETDLDNCHPRTGMPDCKVQAPRPFVFKTGRRDCVSTGSPWQSSSFPSYKTAKPELHADPHGNGNDTLNFFKKEFNFNGRETVAIMGAHTIGRVHAIHSLLRYSWKARSTGLFNNGYYRNLASKTDWYYDSALFKMPCAQGAVANSSGQRPIARWLPHVRGDLNTGGPVQWLQEKFVCPTCRLLVVGSAEYQRCCVGVAVGACKPGCETWKFVCGVDEQLLSAEMGLYKSFQVNAANSIPFGCPGMEKFNINHFGPVVAGVGLKDHTYSWTIIDNQWAEPKCGFNTHADPPGSMPLYQIVELYASNQSAWLADFFPVLEKMLANGYAPGDLEAAPSSGMTDFACPLQSKWDYKRYYTCSACAGCEINGVPTVSTPTTTTTSTNSTASTTTASTTTATSTTTTTSVTSTVALTTTTVATTVCLENPRSNHECPKVTTTTTTLASTVAASTTLAATHSRTTTTTLVPNTTTGCVDNPLSNHACTTVTTTLTTTVTTTVTTTSSTATTECVDNPRSNYRCPKVTTTVALASPTTLAATIVSTTTFAATMVATAVTTTVSLNTVTTVAPELVSAVSTTRTFEIVVDYLTTTTVVTLTTTTTSTTKFPGVPGSFSMTVPNFIAGALTAELPTTKLLFARALASTIGLKDWRLVLIKSIHVDGVKVGRRLQNFTTPRRLAGKTVKIDYVVNTTKVINTSNVNVTMLKADVQKEATAIGKTDWASAIAQSGDWQIVSTGSDMALSPQTQTASTTAGVTPPTTTIASATTVIAANCPRGDCDDDSTTTARIAALAQASSEAVTTTKENGSMVIACIAVGSLFLVACCFGVLVVRWRRKPAQVRATLDEEVEFDSPHRIQPEHIHGRKEAMQEPDTTINIDVDPDLVEFPKNDTSIDIDSFIASPTNQTAKPSGGIEASNLSRSLEPGKEITADRQDRRDPTNGSIDSDHLGCKIARPDRDHLTSGSIDSADLAGWQENNCEKQTSKFPL